MRRVAVEKLAKQGEALIVNEAALRYLTGSLRLKSDTLLIAFDGEGHEQVACLLHSATGAKLVAKGNVTTGLIGTPLTLIYGLPKGDKLDLVARQLCELGLAELALWNASRSVMKWTPSKVERKLQRLERVTQEAARQCGRADQLVITSPDSLTNLIDRYAHIPYRLFLDPHVDEQWPEALSLPCVLLVGPEGGISPEEIEVLQSAGWTGVALNTPVLRTETAAIVTCAIALDRVKS